MKMMSVWEQRTSQIRKHMLASNEALYSEELSPRLASSQHLRPDITTHLDRPLVVEPRGDWEKSRDPQGTAGTPEDPKPAVDPDGQIAEPPQSQPPRKHHHRRRDGQENGETGVSRHHVHHSRTRDADGTRAKEGKGERSHSREGRGEHRHHRSHRAGREGNGVAGATTKGERRSHHRDGSRSANRDCERSSRGEEGGAGGRRKHRQRNSKTPSALEGEEQVENREREEGKSENR